MAQNRTENASQIHYFIWENRQKKCPDEVQVRRERSPLKQGETSQNEPHLITHFPMKLQQIVYLIFNVCSSGGSGEGMAGHSFVFTAHTFRVRVSRGCALLTSLYGH